MNVSLDGILDKIEKNSNLIGIGAGMFMLDAGGSEGAIDNISRAISGQIHVPNLTNMVRDFVAPHNQQALVVVAGSYVAGEFLGGSRGKALQDFAKGALTGHAIDHVLYWSTHSDEGCKITGFTRPIGSTQTQTVSSSGSNYMARSLS